MKPTVKIFVEGKDDKKFVNDYLSFLYSAYPEESENILGVGGWTNLRNAENKFKENTDGEGVNLVIFDADGNPKKRRKEILKKKEELGVRFELFLLPDNENEGDLEILLSNIINPEHRSIFECFDKYERCLREAPDSYECPNRKARIYAYSEALGTIGQMNYLNRDHWRLDNAYLNPLKNFLSAFLNFD